MTDYRQPGVEPPPPTQASSPTRPEILATVAGALGRTAERWAWQGPTGAADQWLTQTGPKDLDLWYVPGAADPVPLICAAFACTRLASTDDPRRVRHTTLSIETPDGPAVVDLTRGDLRVGPVLLVPADQVEFDPARRRLTGAAAVADLLVRPVLRGRLPNPARLAEARAAWDGADLVRREGLHRQLAAELGRPVAATLIAVAAGARPDPGLVRRARLRYAARSLAPDNIEATWAQRRSVLPAGRARGPLGARSRGVVVALVGTDGAGKSTVAAGLDERLRRSGVRTSAVYFGMARGNLPGVALARRLLRTQPTPPAGRAGHPPTPPAGRAGHPPTLDRPALRRVAAWFYAGEYAWRYLRKVGPPLARGHVVIADRWVYDLRESPWPRSRAARFAERLVPAPDVLVLPDAPIEVIHRRKPERPLAEQHAQQERLRRLLAERPARHAEVVVDTSGGAADPLAVAVAAVLEAAHTARRRTR